MSGFVNGFTVEDDVTIVTTLGDNNDVVITAERVNVSTSNNNDAITGLENGSLEGSRVNLTNIDATNNLVIKHNSSSSLAANRIFTYDGLDLTIPPHQSVWLVWGGAGNWFLQKFAA